MNEKTPLLTPEVKIRRKIFESEQRGQSYLNSPIMKSNIRYEKLIDSPSPCTPKQKREKSNLPPKIEPRKLFRAKEMN